MEATVISKQQMYQERSTLDYTLTICGIFFMCPLKTLIILHAFIPPSIY